MKVLTSSTLALIVATALPTGAAHASQSAPPSCVLAAVDPKVSSAIALSDGKVLAVTHKGERWTGSVAEGEPMSDSTHAVRVFRIKWDNGKGDSFVVNGSQAYLTSGAIVLRGTCAFIPLAPQAK
ncbi:hypothetical protein [Bradyrhizobium guangdongense]